MLIRLYRAYSPGIRTRACLSFDFIRKSDPVKFLAPGKKRGSGRNNRGVITLKGRGGCHKRRYRVVCFRYPRSKSRIFEAELVGVEYDPNRSAPIGLLSYRFHDFHFMENGYIRLGLYNKQMPRASFNSYILHPRSLKVGSNIYTGYKSLVEIGNSIPIGLIPIGTIVHSIELIPGKGGQIARSAGTYAQLVAKESGFVSLKFPSKEVRLVDEKCYATVGQIGNVDAMDVRLGKAGRKRWLGRAPKVRGVVKNPVDHPHGGGEGRSPIGMSTPLTPWGKPALGFKTRKLNKLSNRYVLRVRK
jgi:large subunit ribosomal protein L2